MKVSKSTAVSLLVAVLLISTNQVSAVTEDNQSCGICMKKATDQDKVCVEFCAAEGTSALPCNKCLTEAQSMLDSCLSNECADNSEARSYFSIICETGGRL